TEVTYFSRLIKNWIIWLPAGAFWTPQNLMQVWSRGTETFSCIEWHRKKFRVSLTVLSQYVLSTNQKSKLPGDASVGRQLIYTPMYSGLAALSLQFSRLSFIYRHNYVGYRYISTDNAQFLPPYRLGSFSAEYHLKAGRHLWGAFFQLFNIWNVAYQVMSQRPMPGRHFLAGLSWHFQSNSSKTSIRKP
ncbi:MAG: hypothetical protein N2050_07480, partial [Flavobacteriales bacterium]|nr:hypothetical protein [Flavobacteriales bacterium]